jgi:hypothetical protein
LDLLQVGEVIAALFKRLRGIETLGEMSV